MLRKRRLLAASKRQQMIDGHNITSTEKLYESTLLTAAPWQRWRRLIDQESNPVLRFATLAIHRLNIVASKW